MIKRKLFIFECRRSWKHNKLIFISKIKNEQDLIDYIKILEDQHFYDIEYYEVERKELTTW